MEALPTPNLHLVMSPCPHQHLLLPAWPWSLLPASSQGEDGLAGDTSLEVSVLPALG